MGKSINAKMGDFGLHMHFKLQVGLLFYRCGYCE